MRYFIYDNEQLKIVTEPCLPPQLEELYRSVREKYTIDYYCSDWADDDTDGGMGYDYNNSYGYQRAPFREELVVKDGALVGFYVGLVLPFMEKKGIISAEDMKEKFLHIGVTEKVEKLHGSSRYGWGSRWELITEETPRPYEYLYMNWVKHSDRKHDFKPEEFSAQLIEEVVASDWIQDDRGHFDGAFRLKLKMTPEAIRDPDGTMEALVQYKPFLAR